MENLGKEQIRDLKSFSNENRKNIKNDDINNKEKNPEKLLKTLEKRVMFSKNERILRDKYLIKYTNKEIFQRSFKLGKKNMLIKIGQYICNILMEIIKFKEANYNTELIKILSNKQFEFFTQLIIPYF